MGRTGIYACGESVSRCNSSESVVLFSWKQEAPASIGGGTFTKDQKSYYNYYSGTTHSAGDLSSHDEMKFKSVVTEGKRSLQLEDKNLLTFGGEYRKEQYDSTRINGEADSHYEAVYLQDEWVPNSKWTVIPSVRYDHSGDFGGKTTAKLGSTYKFSKNTRFKANVGSAYRARHNIKLSLNFDDSKYSGVTASLWQDWLLNYHYELGSETNDTHLNTLNFVVNKTFKNGLSAYVGVDNIFDQKNENLFADGRVYRFGMKYTF